MGVELVRTSSPIYDIIDIRGASDYDYSSSTIDATIAFTGFNLSFIFRRTVASGLAAGESESFTLIVLDLTAISLLTVDYENNDRDNKLVRSRYVHASGCEWLPCHLLFISGFHFRIK